MAGKQFSSEYQPAKNGRRKSKLKGLIEDQEMSSDDVSAVIRTILDKTEDELKEFADNTSHPYILRSMVKAILKDGESKSLYNINTLLDRAIGKTKDKIDLNAKIEMPTIIFSDSTDVEEV